MRKVIAIFFILSILSCSSEEQEYILIQDNPYKSPFIVNSFSQFKGYFYEGSDKEYHYFVQKWKFLEDSYFKISTDDLFLNEAFMFGEKRLRVNIFPFEDSREFGKTSNYKLYATD